MSCWTRAPDKSGIETFLADPVNKTISLPFLRAFVVSPTLTLAEFLVLAPKSYTLRYVNGFRSGMARRMSIVLGRSARLVQRSTTTFSIGSENANALEKYFADLDAAQIP